MRTYAQKYVKDPAYWSIKQVAMCNRVVFTNGCFDVLHLGHVTYLEQAKALGDVLVVGVNDDESVQVLKGPTRPINSLADRMRVLAALEAVDAVTPMCSLTNIQLLKAFQPCVWVKGGDYTIDSLNRDEVAAANLVGAEIKIIPLVRGFSTTATLTALKS